MSRRQDRRTFLTIDHTMRYARNPNFLRRAKQRDSGSVPNPSGWHDFSPPTLLLAPCLVQPNGVSRASPGAKIVAIARASNCVRKVLVIEGMLSVLERR